MKQENKNRLLSLLQQYQKLGIAEQIDIFIYHLYGLTYDEVLIVDPETPITRKKYDLNN